MSALPPKADIMNHATTGCMGDGVCTPDRIEVVDKCSSMELDRVDRYAKTASYHILMYQWVAPLLIYSFGLNAQDELQYRGRLDGSRMTPVPNARRDLFEAMVWAERAAS